MAQEFVGGCVPLWLLPAPNSRHFPALHLQSKGKKSLPWGSPKDCVKGSGEMRKASLLLRVGNHATLLKPPKFSFPCLLPRSLEQPWEGALGGQVSLRSTSGHLLGLWLLLPSGLGGRTALHFPLSLWSLSQCPGKPGVSLAKVGYRVCSGCSSS
jgi:hypothetical protein